MIELSKIKSLIPESVYDELFETAIRFNLSSPLRIAHFLAQIAHESNNFSAKEENLNYSTKGLLDKFSKYFTQYSAAQCARKPEKIANIVYCNRNGNGNELSGDGWKYRGRGFIQLTGKDNYKAFDLVVTENVVENPIFVATKYPLLSAGWFWNSKRLNDIADLGKDQQIVESITKRVNGGYNGLEDRINKFNKFYGALHG